MQPMRQNESRLLAWALVLLCAMPVAATTLTPLDGSQVQRLAPLLRGSDLVLFESTPKGALRQVTSMLAVAAPPALVREVLVHPERNREFVRNMSRSEVSPVA